MLLRGSKEFVYDENGTEYLDSRNNVPILGHADERIVRAVADQMGLINTNTRYATTPFLHYITFGQVLAPQLHAVV